jgi:hypothetical protein
MFDWYQLKITDNFKLSVTNKKTVWYIKRRNGNIISFNLRIFLDELESVRCVKHQSCPLFC